MKLAGEGDYMLADILKDHLPKGKFWTHPWGLVRGCAPRSSGCQNCWLVRMARLAGDDDLLTVDRKHFNGTIRCMEEVLSAPLSKLPRKPRVWAIWSDFYHEGVSDWFRDNAFEVMSQCPSDYFLIITKRPGNAVAYLTARHRKTVTLPNVIHLVTMETQSAAMQRLPSAAIISESGWKVGALCEPMLSSIDLLGRGGVYLDSKGRHKRWIEYLSWVICGPENGPGKREFDPKWAHFLHMQAESMGAPFLYKANSGNIPGAYPVQCLEVPEI